MKIFGTVFWFDYFGKELEFFTKGNNEIPEKFECETPESVWLDEKFAMTAKPIVKSKQTSEGQNLR